jgi:hypothetical protein
MKMSVNERMQSPSGGSVVVRSVVRSMVRSMVRSTGRSVVLVAERPRAIAQLPPAT